jgi:hypothetical protein
VQEYDFVYIFRDLRILISFFYQRWKNNEQIAFIFGLLLLLMMLSKSSLSDFSILSYIKGVVCTVKTFDMFALSPREVHCHQQN